MSAWRGIDEFVAVAEARSFVDGARTLGSSTTHVSRAVAQLEQRLQTQLLYRTTRTVSLTDSGRTFLEHCRRIIAERDEAFAAVSDMGEPHGELRVTCSTALGERFVAPIARRFAMEHPRLSVSLALDNRVIDLVAEGYDLAIRTGHLADSRLVGTRIAARRLLTCAAPDYLSVNGTPDSVAALATHECLTGSSAHWHFSAEGKEIDIRPRGRWHCNSGQSVLEAALDGMGICQLPDFYVRQHLASGRLIALLPDNVPADEPIWAVYPQRRHLPPKVRRFIDLLKIELPAAMVRDFTGASAT